MTKTKPKTTIIVRVIPKKPRRLLKHPWIRIAPEPIAATKRIVVTLVTLGTGSDRTRLYTALSHSRGLYHSLHVQSLTALVRVDLRSLKKETREYLLFELIRTATCWEEEEAEFVEAIRQHLSPATLVVELVAGLPLASQKTEEDEEDEYE